MLEAAPERDIAAMSLPWSYFVVSADHAQLRLGDQDVALIEGCRIDPASVRGTVVTPLFESLEYEAMKGETIAEARGTTWQPAPVLFAFDEKLCLRSLFDSAYTASRLEFDTFGLAVEYAPYEYAALPLVLELPVGFDELPRPKPSASTIVELGGQGELGVRWAGGQSGSLDQSAALLGVGEALRAFVAPRCAELEQPVLVRAHEDATVGELIDLLIALRGPGCHMDGSGECCVPEVIVDAGFG